MTNIFNFIPLDVLQYVINTFLTPEERGNFNAVLEPTERVFKKFPTNFAEKHALKIAYKAQMRHANLLNYLADNQAVNESAYLSAGAFALGDYADFFTKPVAHPIFVWRAECNHKAQIIAELTESVSAGSGRAPFMTDEIRTKIARAIAMIETHVAVKQIPLLANHGKRIRGFQDSR